MKEKKYQVLYISTGFSFPGYYGSIYNERLNEEVTKVELTELTAKIAKEMQELEKEGDHTSLYVVDIDEDEEILGLDSQDKYKVEGDTIYIYKKIKALK